MNREQKEAAVAELAGELGEAQAIFAVDYRGISVPQAAELRTELLNADAVFRVVKNRLTLRAADQAGTEPIKEWLQGPTALTLVKGDAAAAAKTLTKLGAEFEVLEYKGGLLDGELLEPDQFKAIAKLPSRDQLNAQLAGIVASPITGLVRGLGSMISGLALQLGQIAEQGLVTGEPPKEEPPAEEAPKGDSLEEPSDASAAPAPEDAPADPAGEAEESAEDASASPAIEASPGGSAGEAEQPPENVAEEVAEDDGEAVDAPAEAPAEETTEPEADASDEETDKKEDN